MDTFFLEFLVLLVGTHLLGTAVDEPMFEFDCSESSSLLVSSSSSAALLPDLLLVKLLRRRDDDFFLANKFLLEGVGVVSDMARL